MKTTLEQWPQQLNQALKPCYWLTSDEPLLLDEAATALRQKARTQGFTRTLFHVDAAFDWQQFTDQTQSLSLFSDKQLIECRLKQSKLGDAGVKALQHYLTQTHPDTCALLISPKLEAAAQKTKWFKSLESELVWLPIWPPREGQFLDFLKKRAQHYDLQLDHEALQLLAAQTQGNLLAAKGILERLSLTLKGPVDLSTLREALHDASQFDIFDLVDTALKGQAAQVVRIFHQLIEQGVAGVLILWALVKQVKELAAMQANPGQPIGMPHRQSLLNQALRRLSAPRLAEIQVKAAVVDAALKGVGESSGLDELLDLYILLSGAKI